MLEEISSLSANTNRLVGTFGVEFLSMIILYYSQYPQMVGRAGRAGFGENGESIMICATRDNQRVSELLMSPMDEVVSQMCSDSRALEAMILR